MSSESCGPRCAGLSHGAPAYARGPCSLLRCAQPPVPTGRPALPAAVVGEVAAHAEHLVRVLHMPAWGEADGDAELGCAGFQVACGQHTGGPSVCCDLEGSVEYVWRDRWPRFWVRVSLHAVGHSGFQPIT